MSPVKEPEPACDHEHLSDGTKVPLRWLLGLLAAVVASVAAWGHGRISALEAQHQQMEIRITELKGRTDSDKEAMEDLRERLKRIDEKLEKLVEKKP